MVFIAFIYTSWAMSARATWKTKARCIPLGIDVDDPCPCPDFVNECDGDRASVYTYVIEKVTCPQCLDALEREPRKKLGQLHMARERVQKIEMGVVGQHRIRQPRESAGLSDSIM